MSMHYVCSVSSEVKRQRWIPVEVELQTVVSLHVDARKQIRVLRKSSQRSELRALFLALPPECWHHRTGATHHHAGQQMFVTDYWKTATMVTSSQWELSIPRSHGRLSQERQSKKMSDIKQVGLGWIGHLQMFRGSIPNGQLSPFLMSYEQTHNLQKGTWGFGEYARKKG